MLTRVNTVNVEDLLIEMIGLSVVMIVAAFPGIIGPVWGLLAVQMVRGIVQNARTQGASIRQTEATSHSCDRDTYPKLTNLIVTSCFD